jgi:hypothetical protein
MRYAVSLRFLNQADTPILDGAYASHGVIRAMVVHYDDLRFGEPIEIPQELMKLSFGISTSIPA